MGITNSRRREIAAKVRETMGALGAIELDGIPLADLIEPEECDGCEPGAWIIRLDRPSFKMSSPEGQEYLAMLHDFGAEWVGGVNGWIYLRRRADQGEFELYSDLAGKEHLLLRARSQMLLVLALALVGWLGSLLLAVCSSESFMAVYPVIYLSIPIAVVHGLTRLNRQLKAVRQERQLHE